MRAGEQLRFRGPAGAPFVVTVGEVFDAKTIDSRVKSGEWTPMETAGEKTPKTDGTAARGPSERPAQNASKADWVAYAVDQHGMDREAAESMTKPQLIEATAPKDTTPTGKDDGHGD